MQVHKRLSIPGQAQFALLRFFHQVHQTKVKKFCNYLHKLLKLLAIFTVPNTNDMAAFTIELKTGNDLLSIVVQKLDPWPDNNGYERYELTTRDGSSVISLDADYWSGPGLEPNQRSFFCDNNTFTNAELRKIANGIAKHIAYANQQD